MNTWKPLKEVRSWKIGSPLQEGTYIRTADPQSPTGYFEEQVKDAVKKGAELKPAVNGSEARDIISNRPC